MKHSRGLSILGFITLVALGAGLVYLIIYLIQEPIKHPTKKLPIPNEPIQTEQATTSLTIQ